MTVTISRIAKTPFTKLFQSTAILCATLLGTLPTFGKELPLRIYDPEKYLVQSQVKCLLETSNHQIWVGTLGGINIFTGGSNYQLTTKDGLPSGWINALLEYPDGVVWIGTKGGLAKVTVDQPQAVLLIRGSTALEIRSLGVFQGKVLAGTFQKGIFQAEQDSLVPWSQAGNLSGYPVYDLCSNKDTLWLATYQGIIEYHDTTITRLLPQQIVLSLEYWRKAIWAGTTDGLFRIVSDKAQKVKGEMIIPDMTSGSDKLLISSYFSGLLTLENGQWHNYDSHNGLPETFYKAVLIDHQGSIWLGTDGIGLIQILPYPIVNYGPTSGLSNSMVNYISFTPENWVVVSTDEGVYISHDKVDFKLLEESSGSRVWACVPYYGGRFLMGTDEGTFILSKSGKKERKIWPFALLDALTDGDTVWAATERGPWMEVNGKWQPVSGVPVITGVYCHALTRGLRGIWFATADGLLLIQGNEITRWRDSTNQARNMVWDVVADGQGYLWVGTDGGLMRIREDLQGASWFTEAGSGFPSDIIYSLVLIGPRDLWCGSAKGLLHLTKFHWELFDFNDGLPQNEFNSNALAYHDSKLWAGGIKGLTCISNLAALNHPIPRCYPTRFYENEESVRTWASEYPSDPPTLKVDLGTDDFLCPRPVFRWRLNPQESQWIELKNAHQLQLSALSPGHYQPQVQAGDGRRWGPITNLPAFAVAPPLWQRGWFQTLLALIVALLTLEISAALTENRRRQELLRRQSEQIQLARIFNQGLLPLEEKSIPGLKVSVVTHPREEFSGDFYVLLNLGNDRFALVLGDVAGHGLETSYLNTFVKIDLQEVRDKRHSLDEWLSHLNRKLYLVQKQGLNIALTILEYETYTKKSRIFLAGNPAPWLLNANEELQTLDISGHPPLGVFPELQPHWTPLPEGWQALLLFTDGFEFHPYGSALSQHIQHLQAGNLEKLIALESTTVNPSERDDWTVVLLCHLS